MKSDVSNRVIAVTDAFGLMGPAVIRELLSFNYTVRALLQPQVTLPSEWTNHPHLEVIRGDLLDTSKLEQLLEGVYAVVNTAHLFSLQSKDKTKMRSRHIDGTAHVVNIALGASVKKMIHLSSTEALGHGDQHAGDGPRMNWGEEEEHSFYGRSLFHSELQAWRGQAEGLSVVILRPSFILRACPIANPIADWLEQVVHGLSFFSTGTAGWVDADDVAQAVRLSLDPTVSEQAWVVSAGNFSYKSIIEQLSHACGTRPPIKPWSDTLNPFVSAWNRMRRWWSADTLWISGESLHLSSIHTQYDGTAAASDLGFSYRPIPESIAHLADALERTDWETYPQLLPHQ